MKFNDNNILLNEWKARYEQQNESTKRKLDELKSDLVQGRNNLCSSHGKIYFFMDWF